MADPAQDTTDETGTDLIQIPHKDEVPALFSTEGGIEGLIKSIEEAAEKTVIDISTAAGRKAAKSLAAKVSRSKTLIDEVGKELNEERNRLNKEVNAKRNTAKERLDALRDKIKEPVEAWEAEQAERKRQFLLRLDVFDLECATSNDDTATIKGIIDQITGTAIDDSWEEYEADAKSAKAAALVKYEADLAIAKVREDQAAELEQLRADAAARAAKDAELAQQEMEAKREAEQKARVEAEAKEREQRAAEREKAAAAEAEARAKADAEAAEQRHAERLAAAKREAEEAAQKERDRIAAEKKAEDEAAAARAADKKHRQKIRTEIVDCITAAAPGNWEELVDQMIVGEIVHVKVAI